MPKKNGKLKDNRHSNILRPSTQDNIALGWAVHHRFIELCQTHRRVKGTDLTPPKHLDRDMLLWRTMMVRFKKGDFRNSEDEIVAVRNVAQWTVDVNCELRGQPYKKVEWGD